MIQYKCGHESDGTIILDDNIVSFSVWLEWSESEGIFGTKEKCFDCHCKERSQSSSITKQESKK